LRNIENREQESVELVEKALRQNPNHPKILFLRAQIYENEDKPDQALPLLEKATRIDPYDLPILTLLMKVYRELKKEAQADELKARVQEVQDIFTRLSTLKAQANNRPWDDSVRLEIAQLSMKLNQPEQVRTWAQAALSCNPGNSRARRLLAQVPPKEKTRSPSSSTPPAKSNSEPSSRWHGLPVLPVGLILLAVLFAGAVGVYAFQSRGKK
jgi:tetratricopeptide (TPR) repeat protein